LLEPNRIKIKLEKTKGEIKAVSKARSRQMHRQNLRRAKEQPDGIKVFASGYVNEK
jgi:hypothetical protein